MAEAEPIEFPLWGLGCIAFVAVAIFLEVLGGQYSNSQTPAWAEYVVPIAWPAGLRVVWWLAVAAAAFGYRRAEAGAGIKRNPVIVVASVAPFVIFAFGIATESSWATWH